MTGGAAMNISTTTLSGPVVTLEPLRRRHLQGLRQAARGTDALNQRARRAILKLGAVEEGLLRRHMVVPGGRVRDTVLFAVIDETWPAVRAALEARIAEN